MTKVDFKGKELDLSTALPLKLKDWKALEKRGVTFKQFDTEMITSLSIIAYYVMSKADATITQEDVDDLELNDPALQAVLKSIQGGQAVDRPI